MPPNTSSATFVAFPCNSWTCFELLWGLKTPLDETSIIQVLPRSLHVELLLQAYKPQIGSIKLLQESEAAAHAKADVSAGVSLEVEGDTPIVDMAAAEIWDCFLAKESAIKLVSNCCMDVLRVDQIIMARPAGGPKPKGPNKNWDKDPVFG